MTMNSIEETNQWKTSTSGRHHNHRNESVSNADEDGEDQGDETRKFLPYSKRTAKDNWTNHTVAKFNTDEQTIWDKSHCDDSDIFEMNYYVVSRHGNLHMVKNIKKP